jgi:hypothetical protein
MNARGHLSSEDIDLLMLQALSTNEEKAAHDHLGACTQCKQRWDELNEDKKRFEQYVLPRTLSKVEERVKGESGAGFFAFLNLPRWVPAALSAALIIGVTTTITIKRIGGPPEENYIGIKGGPGLEVIALRGSSQFPVKPGAALQPKDKVRFVVNPAGSKFVLIASRDGAGNFTVYYPFNGLESAPLAGRELPGSVELDEVTGKEWLVAVFSDAPVKADAVKSLMDQGAREKSIEGARVVDLRFDKVKP